MVSDKTELPWPRQIEIDEQFYFFCSLECFARFQIENRRYQTLDETTAMDDDWAEPYCDQCDTPLPGLPASHEDF